MKKCSKCGLEKRLSFFYNNKAHSSGKMARCKVCSDLKQMEWRKRQGKGWWRKYHESYSKRKAKGLYSFQPSVRTLYRRKHRYGIDEAGINSLLKKQKGLCAICRSELNGKFAVDHDHEVNLVRGLLCDWCNRGLGSFKDNPMRLLRAARYINLFQARQRRKVGV
jgi:hypothetical protein